MEREKEIHLYKLRDENLQNFEHVSQILTSFVNAFKPLLKSEVSLPKTITSLSPDILFTRAAEFRAYLDTATTYLLASSVLRLQIKNASHLAYHLYNDALTVIYKSGNKDIDKARGYEEKEMLARSFIDKKTVEAKEFWESTLSDIDDIIGLLKLKMLSFKGGLDTILNQAGLLKIAALNKGFVLNADQQKILDALRDEERKQSKADEGDIAL